MELPWSIRTLDTMKFAIVMEITMGSSWLTVLIPLKSLSVNMIEEDFVAVVHRQN